MIFEHGFEIAQCFGLAASHGWLQAWTGDTSAGPFSSRHLGSSVSVARAATPRAETAPAMPTRPQKKHDFHFVWIVRALIAKPPKVNGMVRRLREACADSQRTRFAGTTEEGRCVTLRWTKRSVKYDAAFSFVKKALQEDMSWVVVESLEGFAEARPWAPHPRVDVASMLDASAEAAGAASVVQSPAAAEAAAGQAATPAATTETEGQPPERTREEAAGVGLPPHALTGRLQHQISTFKDERQQQIREFHFDSMYEFEPLPKLGLGCFKFAHSARCCARPLLHRATETHLASKQINQEGDDQPDPYGFTAEALFLREVRGHPNVIALLDVWAIKPSACYLIFPRYDCPVHVLNLAEKANHAPIIRDVASQMLAGLAWIHSKDIIHCDIKPANIFTRPVWIRPSDHQMRYDVVLAGFSHARSSTIASRFQFERADVPKDGLDIVALWYRAPELIGGMVHYTNKIDVWALGCVIAALPTSQVLFDRNTKPFGQLQAILACRGTGAVTAELRTLPAWPDVFGDAEKQPWDPWLLPALGAPGLRLRSRMLTLGPSDRISAEAAAASGAFDCGVLRPMRTPEATTIFQGERGPFSIQTGNLQPDVLQWLRDDPAWKDWNADGQHGDMGAKRKRMAPNMPDESLAKIEIVGFMADEEEGTNLNGLNAKHPLPFPRLRAWLVALRRANADWLRSVELELHRAMRAMLAEHLGANGRVLMTISNSKWFGHYGVAQLMKMGARTDPRHFDGGASLLHMGLTLWGRRRLALEVVSPKPAEADGPAAKRPAVPRRFKRKSPEAGEADQDPSDRIICHVLQEAGAVYLASICAAAHYVEHFDHSDEELLAHGGCGDLQVAVMLRTSLFPAAMARTGFSRPGPILVYEAAQAIVTNALSRFTFSLPSMELCTQAMSDLKED